MKSRSTYTENFPWHPLQPKSPNSRPDPQSHQRADPPPFHGQTSYKIDYVKHASPQRPKSATGPRKKDKEDERTVPFNGSTTYTTDYKKHPNAQTKRIGPWKSDRQGPSPPFQGNSEYQNQ